MSRADERIRQDLRSMERPVDTRGVLEHVERRKRRRRVVHRASVVLLVAVVVAGTAGGTLALTRLIGPDRGTLPGAGNVEPEPSTVVPMEMCGTSTIDSADLNGDGVRDLVEVYWDPPSPDVPCDVAEIPGPHHVHVEISTGPNSGVAYTQDLPECETPFWCRLFSAPDVDGDGRAEVAITLVSGGSTVSFGLYRFDADAADGRALQRLAIAEPGDPWDPEFGFPAGPALFSWYGSVTHLHWMECDPQRRLVAMTAIRTESDADRYVVHAASFRLQGLSLVLDSTGDEEVPIGRIGQPAELCGSPIVTG